MATETQATSTTPATAAPPPATSAPAETTGQGDGSSSLLSQPPAAKAAGTTETATQPDKAVPDAAGENAAAKPTGESAVADIKLKLPEGFKADEKLLGEFTGIAKAEGLTGEKAQKFFDVYAKAQVAQAEQQRQELLTQWKANAEKAKSDPEYGGKNWDESLASAQKVLTKFGTPELAKLVTDVRAGVGNDPAFIRFLVQVGKAHSEDSTRGTSSSGGVSSEQQSLSALYPSMFKKE